jgi:hypothetical protein
MTECIECIRLLNMVSSIDIISIMTSFLGSEWGYHCFTRTDMTIVFYKRSCLLLEIEFNPAVLSLGLYLEL